VISHGRANLGVGAGWFELEHQQPGYEFGTFSERFERLDEALQIMVPMIEGKRPTFSGKYYCTESAIAEPRYRDHIPTMIGRGGEKKTFGLAARYCDHLNVVADFDELPAKLGMVLAARCAEVGRDPLTLETSVTVAALLDDGLTADQLGQPRTDRRRDQDQSPRCRHPRGDRHPAGSRSHPRQGHRVGPGTDGRCWTVTPASDRLDPCSW
jgi:alkanesulfonate monooxygenase SsuD/methylene tetrahydromethanopterin reductase-like flavin-dependent oxidoreductase (luciferase family)